MIGNQIGPRQLELPPNGPLPRRSKKKHEYVSLRPFDLGLLALATYRTSRLVAYDKVASTYREPFTETRRHPSGAGLTTVPKRSGARRVLGELITGPVCNGTWIAALLVYELRIAEPLDQRIPVALLLQRWLQPAQPFDQVRLGRPCCCSPTEIVPGNHIRTLR